MNRGHLRGVGAQDWKYTIELADLEPNAGYEPVSGNKF